MEDDPTQCRLQLEDYFECLHHNKEVDFFRLFFTLTSLINVFLYRSIWGYFALIYFVSLFVILHVFKASSLIFLKFPEISLKSIQLNG